MTKEEKQFEADRFLCHIEDGKHFTEAMSAASQDLRKWVDGEWDE